MLSLYAAGWLSYPTEEMKKKEKWRRNFEKRSELDIRRSMRGGSVYEFYKEDTGAC